MKKLYAVFSLLILFSATGHARGPGFGVGFSVGVDLPAIQQDKSKGSVFGFKARFEIIPTIVFEPNISFSNYGSPEFDEFENDIEGSKMTAYGLDVTLGNSIGAMGFKPYMVAGIAMYNHSNESTGDVYDTGGARVGWSAGLGIGLGLSPRFDLDARGKINVATSEGGGSKKSLALTGGLNYYFGGN